MKKFCQAKCHQDNGTYLTLTSKAKGRVKKKIKIVEFPTKCLTPPPLSGKKTKNYLLAMKQILYDMGPLTLVRWPL